MYEKIPPVIEVTDVAGPENIVTDRCRGGFGMPQVPQHGPVLLGPAPVFSSPNRYLSELARGQNDVVVISYFDKKVRKSLAT
jgi:hypothetical protein